MGSLCGRRQKGSLRGGPGGGGGGEESFLFTKTKNLLHTYKTREFDLVEERPAIKYIRIS